MRIEVSLAAVGLGVLCAAAGLAAADCNLNGIDDALDIGDTRTQLLAPLVFLHQDGTQRPVTADLDGDGRAEVFYPLSSRAAVLHLELGVDGQLAELPRISTAPLPGPTRAADMDGDGDLDLAVVSGAATLQVQVHLQTQPGAFSAGVPVPLAAFPTDLTAADFNGDRHADLVLGGSGAELVTILSNGRGGLEPAGAPIGLPGQAAPWRHAAADMDGDGDLDLLVAVQQSPRVALLLNDGTARFALKVGALPELGGVRDMAVADVTGDGKLDVAVASDLAQGTITIFRNQRPADEAFARDGFTVGGEFLTVAAGDANQDGVTDLLGVIQRLDAQCTSLSAAWLALGSGATFAAEPPLRLRHEASHLAATGDLDGNGTSDLVAADWTAMSLLALLTRRGTRESDCDQNGVPDSCELAAGDCDRNGRLDVCDLAAGAPDCNRNGLPDGCDVDCDQSGTPDACDIAAGRGRDCNGNALLDACELVDADANGNGIPDDCDLAQGTSPDCNGNALPDESDLLSGLGFGTPWLPGWRDPNGEQRYQVRPSRVATAELNGDGVPDVVIARAMACCPYQEGELLAALALRSGVSPLQRLARMQDALEVIATDFDQDGADELVALEGGMGCPRDAAVLLLHRHGGVELGRAERLPGPEGGASAAFAVDWTGDGLEDLVLVGGAATSFGPLRLLAGDGRGHLVPAGTDGPSVYGLPGGAVADIDGDGAEDLLLTASEGQLVSVRNTRDGAFAAPVPIGWRSLYPAPLVVDAEGDGDMDLVASDCGIDCGLVLLRNDGRGAFPVADPLPARFFLEAGVVVDLDRDGREDVVGLGRISGFDSIENDRALTVFTADGVSFRPGPLRVVGAGQLSDVAATDLTGDGLPDLVLAQDAPSPLAVIVNQGGGELGLPRAQLVQAGELAGFALGDLTGDGRPDAAVAPQFPASIIVLPGVDGALGDGRQELAPGEAIFAVASADLDGDRRDDLAAAEATGIQVLLQKAPGRFTGAPFVPLGMAAQRLAVRDLDADGDLDLACLTPSRVVAVLQTAAGVFARGPSAPVPATPVDMVVADLGGAGPADVAVLCSNPTLADLVATYHGGAGGELALQRNTAVPLLAQTIDAGDLDGDADQDLLVAHFQEASLSTLRQEAGGAWTPLAPTGTGELLQGAIVPDLDADGIVDLVTVGARETHLHAGRSDGSFRRVEGIAMAAEGQAAFQLRDLDADGRVDVIALVRDDDGDWLVVFTNQSGPASYDHDRDGIPDECGPQGAKRFRRGDVDQDSAWNLTDAIAILDHLFLTARPLPCQDAADVNDDGQLNITDAVALLGYLFLGERALASPFARCGFDPTADALDCRGATACP